MTGHVRTCMDGTVCPVYDITSKEDLKFEKLVHANASRKGGKYRSMRQIFFCSWVEKTQKSITTNPQKIL